MMKQTEAYGGHCPYEAPRAELLEMIFGQSILISGSGTLPDTIEEGDSDTFEPFSWQVNLPYKKVWTYYVFTARPCL